MVSKHALRSALVPVVTIFGIEVAFLLSGTVFTERIFAIDGIGMWGMQAATVKDLPVVPATAVLAVTVVMMNIIVDVIYSVLDPRVRLCDRHQTSTNRRDRHADDLFLKVEDLTVRFPTADGLVQAVTDLCY